MNRSIYFATLLGATVLSAQAAPLIFDQNVTGNVIAGTPAQNPTPGNPGGINNGGFTVDRANNMEIGLRARERYDLASNSPTQVTGSNGDGSYQQNAGHPGAQTTRARWNFDWSINSDLSGTSGRKLAGLSYKLGMDFDAGVGTNFQMFDLINGVNPNPAAGGLAVWDHSYGNNGTAQAQGTEASGATLGDALISYNALKAANNLVQNSWNFDFYDTVNFPFNPDVDGTYTIFLQASDATGALLARSEINVIVGQGAQVPEPATLALVGLALAGVGLTRRRKG